MSRAAFRRLQWNSCGVTEKPKPAASSKAWANWPAVHMIFLGTQPTLTQVPPMRPDSTSATRAP